MSGATSGPAVRRAWHPLLSNVVQGLNRVTSFVPPPPSAPEVTQRVVVIHVHPYGQQPSLTLALSTAVCDSLKASGHEVRVSNLYDEGFEPCISGPEHRGYIAAYRDGNVPEDLKHHVENLQWCSALVLCYPTWWYSSPAILKGWFDRVLMPGVAFDILNAVETPNPKPGIISLLTNVKKVGVVTTYGNEFWNVMRAGDLGRLFVCSGLRPLLHPDCTVLWKGLYNAEKCGQDRREAFLKDVRESFKTF